ncbi:MAG: sugar phosphate isomerase/epimerase [Ruminococcaceae bacterium]|nr:sugar phosphate isomerase/epimerase [Oscillospiraceae bacterium]
MNVCSMTSHLYRKYGAEKAIEILKNAGFEGIDFSVNWPVDSGVFAESDEAVIAHFKELRALVDKAGLYVTQTHTPFPTYVADPARDLLIREAVRKALIGSAVLGAKYAIVHPPIMADNRYGSKSAENKALAMEFYGSLIPTLDEWNISIAVENMWHTDPVKKTICPTTCSSAEELCDYVDTLNGMCKNGDRFVVCMDVGHTNLSARDMDVREYVNLLGHRLKALHVHDTDGVHDLHTAPGFGNVDWEAFCLGLRDIGYDGDFTFEANCFDNNFDPELMPDAERLLYRIGRNLCDKYGL